MHNEYDSRGFQEVGEETWLLGSVFQGSQNSSGKLQVKCVLIITMQVNTSHQETHMNRRVKVSFLHALLYTDHNFKGFDRD